MVVPSPVRVLYGYGLFLVLGGLLAFSMAGFEPRARTAVIMGCGSGLVMCACAWLGANGRPKALRLGRGLGAFFAVLFLFRAWKIRDVPEKFYLFNTLAFLSVGSMVAAILMSLAPAVEMGFRDVRPPAPRVVQKKRQ